MNEEVTPDNKGTEEVNNKTPNLPTDEPQETPAEPKKDVDPEMAKWMEETGSLENAYKRVQGSLDEVNKFKDEAETTRQEKADYQAQLTAELKAVADKDPEAAAKLFGYELPQSETPTEQPIINPEEITKNAATQARAQIEVEGFYNRNQAQFKDEEDWNATQDIALSFVGKTDSEGTPYTIQTALRDATVLRHPDLIGDKAISEHLTSQANRASASESGDMPSGTAPEGKMPEGTEELAEEMGINLTPEMKENIANRQK